MLELHSLNFEWRKDWEPECDGTIIDMSNISTRNGAHIKFTEISLSFRMLQDTTDMVAKLLDFFGYHVIIKF